MENIDIKNLQKKIIDDYYDRIDEFIQERGNENLTPFVSCLLLKFSIDKINNKYLMGDD